MIRRSTWILLIIFLIMVAIAFYWERSGSIEEITPTATPQTNLLNLDLSSVTRLEIQAFQGEKISFWKDSAGLWAIEEPLGEVDPSTDLRSIIERFIAVRALSALDVSPPANAIGLDEPVYTISLSLQDGNQSIIEIGKGTVTGSGYYVQVSNKVFIVDEFTVESLLDLLQNPPYITPEAVTAPGGDDQLSGDTPSP